MICHALSNAVPVQLDLPRLEHLVSVLHAVHYLRRVRTTECRDVPGGPRGVATLAHEDLPAPQAMNFLDHVGDDTLHHPVAVEQPIVDAVVVLRTDGPRSAGYVHHRRVTHERIGFEEVIRYCRKEDVLGVLDVKRILDVDVIDVLEFLLQELAGVFERRHRDSRCVADAIELLANSYF